MRSEDNVYVYMFHSKCALGCKSTTQTITQNSIARIVPCTTVNFSDLYNLCPTAYITDLPLASSLQELRVKSQLVVVLRHVLVAIRLGDITNTVY